MNKYKRNYEDFHEAEFEEIVIKGTDWDEICMLRLRNPNVSVKNFFDTLNFHLDEMAPFEKVTLKKYRLMLKPWITSDILNKCDERHNTLKLVKEETDPTLLFDLRRQDKNLQNILTVKKGKVRKPTLPKNLLKIKIKR